MNNGQPQLFFTANPQEEMLANPERAKYQSIPLDSIASPLQGSDPADLALNVLEGDTELRRGLRKVEVSYPQPNQALVTIAQTSQGSASVKTMKYRVELTTFGRSLFVSSPRVWQIVWAGSQEKCIPGSSHKQPSKQNCQ
ncbi:hypothetical protein NUACC21_32480 [Scytonema sp. NUACC21]